MPYSTEQIMSLSGPLPDAANCTSGPKHPGSSSNSLEDQGNDINGTAQTSKAKEGQRVRALKGPLKCQVEDCCKDLTNEKSYYQRHRICEVHLKTLSIEMHGKPSRFCQQCARFQPLTDFEGSKRSCKLRLHEHNMRRRKNKDGMGGMGGMDNGSAKLMKMGDGSGLSPNGCWAPELGLAQFGQGNAGLLLNFPQATNQFMPNLSGPAPYQPPSAFNGGGIRGSLEAEVSAALLGNGGAGNSLWAQQQQQQQLRGGMGGNDIFLYSGPQQHQQQFVNFDGGISTDGGVLMSSGLSGPLRDIRMSSSSNNSAWTINSGNLSAGTSNQLPDLIMMPNGLGINGNGMGVNGNGNSGFIQQRTSGSSDGSGMPNGLAQQQQQQQFASNLPLGQQLQQLQQLQQQQLQQLQLQQQLQQQQLQQLPVSAAAGASLDNGVKKELPHLLRPGMLGQAAGGAPNGTNDLGLLGAVNAVGNMNGGYGGGGGILSQLSTRHAEELMVRVSMQIAGCMPEQLPDELRSQLESLLSTADASQVQSLLLNAHF